MTANRHRTPTAGRVAPRERGRGGETGSDSRATAAPPCARDGDRTAFACLELSAARVTRRRVGRCQNCGQFRSEPAVKDSQMTVCAGLEVGSYSLRQVSSSVSSGSWKGSTCQTTIPSSQSAPSKARRAPFQALRCAERSTGSPSAAPQYSKMVSLLAPPNSV